MSSRIRTTEELRDALKQKLDELKAAFKADAVTLHLYDPQRERLYFPVGVNLLQEQRFMQGVPSMERVAGKIVRSRMPIIAEDAEHHPDLTGPFTHVEKVKTAAGFPLVVPDSGEVMGVLFVDYRRPYQFEEDETERIQSQASELAEFISRSLQGDQGRMLRDALRMEADFRIEEARLQEIVNRLWDILGDVDIALWTQERGKRNLRIKMHAGMDRDFVDRVFVNLDTDSSNLVSVAFVDGKEVLIESPQTDPGAIFDVASPVTWQRMLAMPVSSRYLRLGVLCAFRRERIGFTRRERDLVRAFANLIAVTIENEDRIIALSALHDMGVRLTLATDLGDIMQEVVQSACQVIGADVATVHLYNPVRQEFYDLERSAVFPPESQSDMEKPRGEGGFGARIIKQGRIYCDDVDAQVDAVTPSTFVREQGIKAYVGTPLISIDEPLGVLYVSFKEKRRFSPEDLALVQILANYASTAIYRAGLLDQRTAVMEIARDITSVLDGDKLLQQTLERSLELLNCEIGSISVFDPKTNTLQFRYAVGKPPDISVRLGEGLIGTAAETRRPVRVRDVRQDDRYVCHVEETISELDVPMLVGEHLIGVLNAESKRLNAFSEEDQLLAQALAAQAAVAFRTAELYEEAQARLQERVGDIKALQDIYALIGTAPLKDMLEQIAEEAARLTPAKYTGIWLLDERTRELRFGARNRTEEKPTQSWPRLPLDGTSISGQVALTGKTYRCDDVRGDPYYQEWYEDVRSELTTPLVYGGRVIGILDLESTDVGAFTDDHARLVEALAGAAAAAIQNARLYDRLDTLVTVGQAVASTLELDEVLDQILQGSLDALGANYGTLRWLNKATGELALRTHRGEIGDRTHESVRLGEGATGWVAQHGKPLLIGDVREDTRYLKFLAGTRCELAVPIKVGNRTVGVLNVEHPQSYAFDGHDMRLLEAIAGQAATAIHNARLYEASQTVNEVGRALTSGIRLKEEEILELIYSQASQLMNTDNISIALYNDVEDMVRFGLAIRHGKRIDVATEQGWEPRPGLAGKGKTNDIIRTKKPILLSTRKEEEDWYAKPGRERYIEESRASWLGVPMMIGEKVLGVIDIYSQTQEYAYSGDDLEILQAIANYVAIALDNWRVFNMIEALVELGRMVTSGIRLREDKILELIHRQASQLMDTDNMYIALYDEATDTVRFGLAFVDREHIDVATHKDWQPRKTGKGRTEHIVRTKQPLFHPTREEGERWYAEPEHEEYIGTALNSWLGVPMTVGERVLGVIATYHPTRDYVYTGDDLEILQGIANQAAIALDNAHMYYDVNRRLEALVEFGRMVTSGIRLREDKILELIHSQASQLMDTDNMYIALYDEATDTVRFGLAFVGGERIDVVTRKDWQPRKTGKGRTEHIVRTKRPLFHPTREEGEKWYAEPGHEEYVGRVSPSWLGVPMMVGERVLGVIATYHPTRDYVYSGDDLGILQAMANQAAVAIENARLHRERQIQLEKKTGDILASREIDRAIADKIGPGPELQSVLELILEKALERTGASSGNIMWRDEATGDLVMRAGRGVLRGKERARQKVGEGIVGLVARERKTYRIGDVTEEPWKGIYIQFIPDVRSELATPLTDGEALLGVLNVEDSRVDAFDEEDTRWLEDLAVRVVIAIRGAKAIEALQQEEQRRIAAEKFGYLGTIAAGLAHRMNSIAGMVRVCERELRDMLDLEDRDIYENLNTIAEETGYMLALAEGLFKPTQALEEQMQPTDLNLLLRDAIDKAHIPTGVDVACVYADRLPLIPGNKWFIEMFVELTKNAIKAMNDMGQLRVGSRLVNDNWVEVWVSDTGYGIPPENRERIFDLFFAKREGEEKGQVKGFGFGLWWIKTFLIGIGGSIDLESEIGVGTTFVVRLPRKHGAGLP